MKRTLLLLATAAMFAACAEKPAATLKEAFENDFYIGTAMNVQQILEIDKAESELVAHHFSAIVAENCMKSEEIHPEKNRYFFDEADAFVAFGEKHGMFITGHTLVWHSQLAPWFPYNDAGEKVSREEMVARLKDHISTVVGRYKGRIKGWDVVNEAILDDGSLRMTPFLEIIGEDYLELAFQFAHEADPDAELYYNDYSMASPAKRARVVQLVRDLKQKGIRIDGVGMQGHMGMDYPDVAEFEKSLLAYAAEGVKVMITEWDISALPTVRQGAEISDTVAYMQAMNPYPDGLPAAVEEAWNERVRTFMDLFLKHSDKISRVTAWGVTDRTSWLNNWPMPGRKNYPLLFDRDNQLKPVMQEYLNRE